MSCAFIIVTEIDPNVNLTISGVNAAFVKRLFGVEDNDC